MHKILTSCLVVAVLAAMCSTSAYAQASKTQDNAKDNKAKTTTQETAKKAEKPAASPGWIVIEEDWWFPHMYSFSDSLHNTRVHFRAHEEKAAAAEIEKAATWLKFAENYADKSYAGELSIAYADLMDFARDLRNGGSVNANKLSASFAHASAALGKHHHFQSNKALAEGDMKKAGQNLLAAANHVRNAATSANHETGSEVVEVCDYYAPLGYLEETVKINNARLGKDLKSIKTELDEMAAQLGAKR